MPVIVTHAAAVSAARDAVVEAAKKWARSFALPTDERVLDEATEALLALEAATCPECEGYGQIAGTYDSYDECPAKCDNGKRRDA